VVGVVVFKGHVISRRLATRLAPGYRMAHLLDWFTAHSGTFFDRDALTFAQIDTFGWGAFALRDLQVQLFFFFHHRLCWKHGQLIPFL
jgi:hypothetical protein